MQLHFYKRSEMIMIFVFWSPVAAVVSDTAPLHFIPMSHQSSLLTSVTNDMEKR